VHGEAPAPSAAAPVDPPKPDPAAALKSYALLAPDVKRHYLAYFKMVFDDGRLDLRTKELIALGAALMTGAPNVLAGHLAKLRRLGVSEEEIAEAVAVALGVAGASVVDRGDVAEALLKGKAGPGGKP
jgi:AhpD family alkylhydroperoxidase